MEFTLKFTNENNDPIPKLPVGLYDPALIEPIEVKNTDERGEVNFTNVESGYKLIPHFSSGTFPDIAFCNLHKHTENLDSLEIKV